MRPASICASLLAATAWLAPLATKAAPPPQYLTLSQLRARYWEPGARLMNIGGVEVYYKDEGRGPAILMIHGSSSTLRTYDGVAARLKDRYRIIRYDIPPLGLSGPVPEASAQAMKPEDVPSTLLDRLGVKSVTAVGVSSGGTMAIFLAAKRPELVRRLILSNSPAAPVDTSHMKLSRRLAQEQAALGPAINNVYKPRSFWDPFFDFFAGEPSRISPEIRNEYYDINRRTPEPNPRALTAVVADQTRFRKAAEAVTCPVLLVWGGRDPLLGGAADVLAGYLKNAQVSKLLLPDVGHYPPLEVPARYAQIVATDIEAVTPVRPVSPPPAER